MDTPILVFYQPTVCSAVWITTRISIFHILAPLALVSVVSVRFYPQLFPSHRNLSLNPRIGTFVQTNSLELNLLHHEFEASLLSKKKTGICLYVVWCMLFSIEMMVVIGCYSGLLICFGRPSYLRRVTNKTSDSSTTPRSLFVNQPQYASNLGLPHKQCTSNDATYGMLYPPVAQHPTGDPSVGISLFYNQDRVCIDSFDHGWTADWLQCWLHHFIYSEVEAAQFIQAQAPSL